jgi:imidazolonepropionase-like amidohydrolase
VRNGRIEAAGANVAVPGDVPVLDGEGAWVTPGLFSALTDLGLYDVEAVEESDDRSARRSPFGAALDVAPAYNPANEHVAVSRAGGVTRALVAPIHGGSIFAGQGAVVDLGADAEAVTHPRAFQLVALGEGGARIAGGSRTAAHALFRNALREAADLDGQDEIAGGMPRTDNLRTGDDLPIDPRLAGTTRERGSDVLLTRFDAAALIPVVRGEQKLFVEVERASDIRQVLALKDEFPALDLVLVGALEGWMVADEIAAAGVPVITQPLVDLPARFEQLAATQSNVGIMADAGVEVAFGAFYNSNQPRYGPQQAGNIVALTRVPGATGMSWGEAFAAITSVPAAISGLEGEAGILAPGAHGDVVLWDGDPMENSSGVLRVYIDGVEQPLVNHQTRLRDRYRDLDESDLPKAYDW